MNSNVFVRVVVVVFVVFVVGGFCLTGSIDDCVGSLYFFQIIYLLHLANNIAKMCTGESYVAIKSTCLPVRIHNVF